MLIYNYQKEFLGIDEKDLKTLGFNSLSELRAEVTDFADLFVKTPGYVHNFQHVHWIDFITYADVSEESKVLINVNAKTFKATVTVSTLFLIDNPNSPAYMIHLNNLRPLTKSENENLSSDILDKELPQVEPQETKVFTPAPEVAPAVKDAYDIPSQQETASIEIDLDEPLDIEEPTQSVEPETEVQEKTTDTSLDIADISMDVFDDEILETETESTANEIEQKPLQPSVKKIIKKEIKEEWDNGYHYDPNIASKELGLPLDLIEEFIQDFIAQAKEFKTDIYTSIEDGDVDNVKILSHKLKGVAANLRIEDAHEVLSAVSATTDMDLIHENLDTFYKIITKLAGEPAEEIVFVEEEITEEAPTQETSSQIEIDDEDLKLDILEVADEDVPQKIEMPELADDDFLSIEIADNDLDIKSNDEDVKIDFSKAAAAQEIGIDESSFNELFEDFVTESHAIFAKIKDAINNDDLQSCHNEALKFKGMSDNMRFHEFTNELETLIHSSDKDEIANAAEKINTSLLKISQAGA